MWAAGMHWSASSDAWCGLFHALPDGRVLLRHELTWLRTVPEVAALELRAFVKEQKITLAYVVADPKLFPKKKAKGETVSETFSRAGLPMMKGDDDPINGWSRVRSWLQPMARRDLPPSPSLLIHSDCAYLIRTLPTLVSASENEDIVDDTPDSYPARGVMYYVMSRPMPTKDAVVELPKGAIGHELRELRAELASV